MGMPIDDTGQFSRQVVADPAQSSGTTGRRVGAGRAGWRWLLVVIPLLVALLGVTFAAQSDARAAAARPVATSPLAVQPAGVAWSDFAPAGWVTVLPATSQVTAQSALGLEPATAAYALSTDAGGAWSAWTTAGLSVSGAVSTTQTLQVTGLTLPDAAAANLIRFRIQEISGTLEISPDYTIRVDTAAPTVAVISPNGGEVWAGGQAQTITWDASDAVGLVTDPITISVSYDDGATWEIIAAGLANTGNYPWTPPAQDAAQVWVEVAATDGAGLVGRDRSDAPFALDSSAPAAPQNLTATPGNWTNVNNFTLTWTNPPDIGSVAGAWYKFDLPPAAPDDGVFVATTNSIFGIVLAEDGAHPVYVWLQDALGHADHTATAMTALFLDRVAPAPPFNLQGEPGRTWTNVNRFSLRWTNPVDTSGIAGAYYRIDQPGFYPTDGILVPTTDVITDITVPGDGKHDMYIWLVDQAGNVDHNSRNVDPQVFWYDSAPPVSTATLAPPLAPTGWYSTSVTVAFTATDDLTGSGVAALFQRLDEAPWSSDPLLQVTAEGEHVVTYYAQDVAGNQEAEQTLAIAIDLTPPIVWATPDRLPNATGWYTAPVTLDFTVIDAPSGQADAYFRTNDGPWQQAAQIELSTSGSYTIDYYAQDPAGNRSAIATTEIKLDTAPPATAYLIRGDQGEDGWYVTPLAIDLIPTDSTSGVAATYYRIDAGAWQVGTQFQLVDDGNYTLSFYSVDAAGNRETSYPVQVKLDTAAPGGPTAVETSPGGWSRVNRFSVQWANPTDLSGIVGVYYRLNQEPATPTDGVFAPLTNRLDELTVPVEGTHRLYLWLRDGAGNADQRNRTLAPLLRYDATPPTTVATVQGLAGTDGWYRGPVTVLLEAADLHSGVARLRYRLNGADWVTTTQATAQIPIAVSDKHVLEFGSEDAAGNMEVIQQLTVRTDGEPPAAPTNLRAEPEGWQRYNSFRLTWRAPLDQSGIAGAYVRFDAAPTGPDDGVFYPAVEVLEGLQVPAEGRHSLYVWLRDGAGNADHTTAVALADALWYDGVPPVTTVTRSGALGSGGWYVGPVTFTLAADDAVSGVVETRYQVDDAAWAVGDSFVLTADGAHTVRVASVDAADNVEPAQVFEVALDQVAPRARLAALSRYQPQPRFDVSWGGDDPAPGSGLAAFDVQVRDGYVGTWQAWLTATRLTAAAFEGQRGHTYFFRIAARDRAGNRQPFTADQVFATVETVLNGSFDTGTFAGWTASGLLYKAVVPLPGPFGGSVLAARLGSEDYGPSLTDPGQVPVSSATISQTLRVPDLGQVQQPTLTFWYRVFSYDVMYSQWLQRDVDTFDVTLHDATGQQIALLLRDGNPTQDYRTLYDTGWKRALIDLSPYAGQTVQLVFANHNRHDNLFNTWSYLDDVRVRGWPYSYRMYLPAVLGDGAASSATAAGSTPSAPSAEPDAARKR